MVSVYELNVDEPELQRFYLSYTFPSVLAFDVSGGSPLHISHFNRIRSAFG